MHIVMRIKQRTSVENHFPKIRAHNDKGDVSSISRVPRCRSELIKCMVRIGVRKSKESDKLLTINCKEAICVVTTPIKKKRLASNTPVNKNTNAIVLLRYIRNSFWRTARNC